MALEALAEDDDLLSGSEDYPEDEAAGAATGDTVAGAGALSSLDMPGAKDAIQRLINSSHQARAALQQAREKITGRQYNKGLALLAISGALGQPTRSGSASEGWANAANALMGPVREKAQFEASKDKELLGIDSQIAGLDQNTAQAELQLAALRAKLANSTANAPNNIVIGEDGVPRYAARQDARGKRAYTQPSPETKISVNTENTLYGTLAKNLGDEYTAQYKAAQDAAKNLEHNANLRTLLKARPYTGTLAEWKLKAGKLAKSLGFDYAGDDIANTELLISNLGQETLNNVKASGLGTGQGFTDKDLRFLQSVVGGTATLDAKTLADLADLHERSTRLAAAKWNSTFDRLDPARMKELGVTKVTLPGAQTSSAGDPAALGTQATEPGEPSANPDDELPAIDSPAPTASAAPSAANVPPLLRRPDAAAVRRAPPQMEAYLREHPETAPQFEARYGYLPNGIR